MAKGKSICSAPDTNKVDMEPHGSPLAASDGQNGWATMDGGSLNNFDDEWKQSFPYAEEMNDR